MREPSATSSPPTNAVATGTRAVTEKEAMVLATLVTSSMSVGASMARTMCTWGSSMTVLMACSKRAESASPMTSTGLYNPASSGRPEASLSTVSLVKDAREMP
ncbi:MAG: hypothetical protein A4E29_01072 [Methanomassiliicoccales archaeon PtaB.Bin134]|nr:MAG: hypothetical protein A4E29_01072 [Methanomassiliicoccales archaeon PtaB.Bin134]